MQKKHKDIAILGGGMVGLAMAHQIKKQYPDLSILIIDKELSLGLHSSGRNSGVLHAGIYYKPNTLKAKVCVDGAKRLKNWCKSEGLPILECGKIISPQKPELDNQLEILIERGKANGAKVLLIDEKEFKEKVPNGRTASGRAIWSPQTCVVNPKIIIERLGKTLKKMGVEFLMGQEIRDVDVSGQHLTLKRNSSKNDEIQAIHYGHLFNCTGLQADRIAKKFGVGDGFRLLPFKGIYWKLHPKAPFTFRTNLYPVPDLKVPFLGVHITPSTDGSIYLGPTAIPAWGRENYQGIHSIEPLMAIGLMKDLSIQWLKNSGGFRKYAQEQALHGLKPLFLEAARALIPNLESKHLIESGKVGIRAQLYNHKTGSLVQDFVLEKGIASTHVLNAISPAFTASFALADVILKHSSL